jgi:hypothetical protein
MVIRTAAANFCENRTHRKEGSELFRFLPKGYSKSSVDLSTTDGHAVQALFKTPVQPVLALKEFSTQLKVTVNDSIVPRERMDSSALQSPSPSKSVHDLDFIRHEVFIFRVTKYFPY